MKIYILEKNSTYSNRTSLNFQVGLKFKTTFFDERFSKCAQINCDFLIKWVTTSGVGPIRFFYLIRSANSLIGSQYANTVLNAN